MTALHDLTAAELSAAYAAGTLSPLEATRAALERIAACERGGRCRPSTACR
jgi:Asp-tRNA(Asn)/Glu-tRNA(Gln) amidotransferase A subunit family amidase